MPQSLIRYAFDPTGVDPNNRVQDEVHTLANRRVRAIAPLHGYIYTNDFLAIDQATTRHLVHGPDYVFAELSTVITRRTGKEAVGIVLIVNPEVSANVIIDYQAVGGDGNHSGSNMESLVTLLGTTSDDAWSQSFWDIKHRPNSIVPSPHLHDLGDGFGFETLVFALEKLRSAILWSDNTAIDSLLKMVDDYLLNLTSILNHRVDTEILAAIIRYKDQFTKSLIGLGKVQNLDVATAEEGMAIANPEYRMQTLADNKYIATAALSGFKEVLYSQMVSSGMTNLGKSYGVIGLPLKSVLLSMTNGARIMLESHAMMTASGVGFDEEVYPDVTRSRVRWTIVKASNNETDRGGAFIGIDMGSGAYYTGIMTVTALATNITWKRIMTTDDSEQYLKELVDHMNNPHNPHKTRKVHVGLGEVENLPVATREDIICRKPKRAYMTYDGHLLFMKAFMTGMKDVTEIDEDDTTPNAVAKYQLLFSPCGPCGSGDLSNFSCEPTTPPVTQPPRPRGELLTKYCVGFRQWGRFSDGFGGSYEELINANSTECGYVPENTFPTRGALLSTFCEEKDKIGRYADGGGGFYTRVIEANSLSCIPGGYTATYEFRDLDGLVYGLGYAPSDVADPDATVLVYNDADELLCRIYDQVGPNRSVEIKNTAGFLIGYAVNPEPTP